MIEQDTIKLLRECDAGVKMGISSIDDVVKYVKSGELRERLERCRADHAKLDEELQGLLERYRDEGKELSVIAKGMSRIKTEMNSMPTEMDEISRRIMQLEIEEAALKKADLNEILTMDMIATILTAQNFSMPAGYVEQDGVSYMLSIGDPIEDAQTLENLMLFDLKMDGVDPIYLKDVAAVMVTDNRDSTYAKLGKENSIMLSFEKQSTFATAETTNNINARFRELEQEIR